MVHVKWTTYCREEPSEGPCVEPSEEQSLGPTSGWSCDEPPSGSTNTNLPRNEPLYKNPNNWKNANMHA
jgi:hypothetical protein